MIRIIAGIYGHRPAGKVGVTAVRPGDPPIELSPEDEDDLVERGVAEYVVARPSDGGVNKPAYSMEMKMVELQEVAAGFGVDAARLEKLRSKKDVIAAIEETLTGGDSGGGSGSEAPPSLDAKDPE